MENELPVYIHKEMLNKLIKPRKSTSATNISGFILPYCTKKLFECLEGKELRVSKLSDESWEKISKNMKKNIICSPRIYLLRKNNILKFEETETNQYIIHNIMNHIMQQAYTATTFHKSMGRNKLLLGLTPDCNPTNMPEPQFRMEKLISFFFILFILLPLLLIMYIVVFYVFGIQNHHKKVLLKMWILNY